MNDVSRFDCWNIVWGSNYRGDCSNCCTSCSIQGEVGDFGGLQRKKYRMLTFNGKRLWLVDKASKKQTTASGGLRCSYSSR